MTKLKEEPFMNIDYVPQHETYVIKTNAHDLMNEVIESLKKRFNLTRGNLFG